MVLKPAPVNHGIKFKRVDLQDDPIISARFNCVVDTSLAPVVGSEGAIVSTVEHLMACLAGLSIDNAMIELDAYEVPVMDGSAGPFTRMIMEAGIQNQEAPRQFFVLKDAIELRNLSDQDINIGGWFLSDGQDDFKKFQIPSGTMLPGATVLHGTRYEVPVIFGPS